MRTARCRRCTVGLCHRPSLDRDPLPTEKPLDWDPPPRYRLPPPCEQTNTCENITFLILRMRVSIIHKRICVDLYCTSLLRGMYFSVQINFFNEPTIVTYVSRHTTHHFERIATGNYSKKKLKNIISENVEITTCIGSSFNSQDMCRFDIGIDWQWMTVHSKVNIIFYFSMIISLSLLFKKKHLKFWTCFA